MSTNFSVPNPSPQLIKEAERVKEQTKNVGHDYFLLLILLNIAGSDIKNQIKLEELVTVEKSLDVINTKFEEVLK